MAKETKPAAKHAHAPAKSTSSAKTWLIAAVAVIVIILLIVWGQKAGEAPAQQVTPTEEAPAPEAAAEEAPAAEAPPVPGVREYDRVLGPSGNAETVSSTITWRAAGGQPVTKEDDNTMFSDISCQHAESTAAGEADKTTLKEDTVSFTFTNKGQKTYHLYYIKYGSEGYEDALRIGVNGRRVRDVEKACGQKDLAPGETASCNGAAALLRTGETYTGKVQVNILQAQSVEFIDNLVFKC